MEFSIELPVYVSLADKPLYQELAQREIIAVEAALMV